MALKIAEIRKIHPRDRRYTVFDGRGLGLEVMPSGLKVWRTHYRLAGRHGVITLGRFPHLGMADARKQHCRVLAAFKAGQFSPEQNKNAAITLKAFAERYMREVVAKARKAPATIQRWFDRDIYPAIGSKPLVAITKEDLQRIIYAKRDAGHKQAGLAIRNLLKRLWDYAIEVGLTEINRPGLIKAKFIGQVSSRSRALSEAELGTFLRGLDKARLNKELKTAFKLILLTLTRKSELRLARWEHINLAHRQWAIPQENSKTGAAQIVYLSRQAVELLQKINPNNRTRGFVFAMRNSIGETPIAPSTLNRALKRIPIKIEHFTVHDLRRTAATILAEKEFNADWIEKALNHKLKGVRGVYNRAQYATQRQTMLQVWADYLDKLKDEE